MAAMGYSYPIILGGPQGILLAIESYGFKNEHAHQNSRV